MSGWFFLEETSGGPIPRTQSSRVDLALRTCAACESRVSVEVPWLESKRWPEERWAFGLDGRPSYRDADLGRDVRLLEEQELRLETCPRCDHVAPYIDIPFPDFDVARARRESLASLGEYGRTALRYIYVSALYGDADPHRRGLWLLRAAWATEAMGLAARGGELRRLAATSFEESIAGGVAVELYRGGTSLVMSELYRVGGDFERAAEHCRRGLLAISASPESFAESTRVFFLAEADRIVARKRDVLRRQTVKDEFAAASGEPRPPADSLREGSSTLKSRRAQILAAIEAACPTPPPLRQTELRSMSHRGLPSLFENMVMFAKDFLDVDRLIPHLKRSSVGVWEAVWARPHLLAPLLLAADHEDAVVRKNVLSALYNRELPRSTLDSDALDALARRLFDDDETVCRVGPILQKVLPIAPAFADRVRQAAQAALEQRAHDLSAEGVLERLGARRRR